jgi:hypothetical protein
MRTKAETDSEEAEKRVRDIRRATRRIGAFFGNDLPPLQRGRNSEYYSIAMITMAAAYNLTINSDRTLRTLTIDRQRKS